MFIFYFFILLKYLKNYSLRLAFSTSSTRLIKWFNTLFYGNNFSYILFSSIFILHIFISTVGIISYFNFLIFIKIYIILLRSILQGFLLVLRYLFGFVFCFPFWRIIFYYIIQQKNLIVYIMEKKSEQNSCSDYSEICLYSTKIIFCTNNE